MPKYFESVADFNRYCDETISSISNEYITAAEDVMNVAYIDLVARVECYKNDFLEEVSKKKTPAEIELILSSKLAENLSRELESFRANFCYNENSVTAPETPEEQNLSKKAKEYFNKIFEYEEDTQGYKEDLDELKNIFKEININRNYAAVGNLTFLHWIIKSGTDGMLPILKSFGADPNIAEEKYHRNSPICSALSNGFNEAALELLDVYGSIIDLRLCKGYGTNPLHLVLLKGYRDQDADGRKFDEDKNYSCYALMEKMLNIDPTLINIKGKNGLTAMHIACLRKDPKMIEILLEKNSSLAARDKNGKTPGDLLELDYQQASQILEDAVIIFNLDEEEFNKNKNACKGLVNKALNKKEEKESSRKRQHLDEGEAENYTHPSREIIKPEVSKALNSRNINRKG